MKELQEQINRNDLIQEQSKYKYGFRNVPTIRSLGDNICNSKITVSEANKQQRYLLKAILQLNYKVRPKSIADKVKSKYL